MLQARSWIEPQTEQKNWNIDHQYVMLCILPCLQVPSYISIQGINVESKELE
jgi:hypothetical protein